MERSFCKFKQWLSAWGAEYGMSMRGLMSTYGVFGLATTAVVLVMLYRMGVDRQVITEEIQIRYAEFIATGAAFCFWASLNLFSAAWRAGFRLKSTGAWDGDDYIYHQPKTVASFRIHADKSPFRKTIKLPDVPRRALVRVKAEPAADRHFWNASVFPPGGMRIDFGGAKTGNFSSAMLGDNKEIVFEANAVRPDAAPITFRVVLDSWTFQTQRG